MTTRHNSAQIAYPFEEPASVGTRAVLAGILDAYFHIQGAPTGAIVPDRAYPYIKLVSVTPGAGVYRYAFEAVADELVWELTFDIPTAGGMGQVSNNDATSCAAVLIFDTALLYTGPTLALAEYIEPSRAEWHTEQVEALQVYNIGRCAGVEQEGLLLPVATYVGGVVALADGFNTALDYAEDTGILGIAAGSGLGAGEAPGFGDTAGGSSSGCGSNAPVLTDYVSVINGIAPVNGDIPIAVSPSLGINRQTGQLEIVVKN